jgi:ribosomal protein L7Ae-like RNA K-turn-binding protein
MTQFITEYENRIDNINYSYDASSAKDLQVTLNEIFSQIQNPKNKFILLCEDNIDYDKMQNILEKWKNDIIIINREN